MIATRHDGVEAKVAGRWRPWERKGGEGSNPLYKFTKWVGVKSSFYPHSIRLFVSLSDSVEESLISH